jgi:hypothetical protein
LQNLFRKRPVLEAGILTNDDYKEEYVQIVLAAIKSGYGPDQLRRAEEEAKGKLASETQN